ncbi:hypothetical protein GCM10007424_23550 [Flavobacterium suaedae]|uniref:Uncharacterized protein n=1 Tax=Flavobacterium suaedae TaxID=1767027 RepID=A0ABQ1JZF3_9FLAO|nr:hypothetical protein [Flavobacterium suaedae]GGB82808.1 hypothetical protein GCM10007424_23550 [Flavobacterium suaedae]
MKKIKRMLAFMLKDELIELVEHKHVKPYIQVVEVAKEFNTLKLEFAVNADITTNQFEYENALNQAKQKMFNEVEKCIQVSCAPLISHEFSHRRFVRLTLRVQKPSV